MTHRVTIKTSFFGSPQIAKQYIQSINEWCRDELSSDVLIVLPLVDFDPNGALVRQKVTNISKLKYLSLATNILWEVLI